MSGIALKLTSLAVRTIAKPIATALRAQAKEHERFRNGCIRIAQTLHSTDLKLRMSLLGEKRIKIRPLNDKKAIENGATFLSEMFIFGVAGSLILYESYRSRKKTSDHRDGVYEDMAVLQAEIDHLREKLGSLTRVEEYPIPEETRVRLGIRRTNSTNSTETNLSETNSSDSEGEDKKSEPKTNSNKEITNSSDTELKTNGEDKKTSQQ